MTVKWLIKYLCGSTTALRNSRSKYTPRSFGPKLNQAEISELWRQMDGFLFYTLKDIYKRYTALIQ